MTCRTLGAAMVTAGILYACVAQTAAESRALGLRLRSGDTICMSGVMHVPLSAVLDGLVEAVGEDGPEVLNGLVRDFSRFETVRALGERGDAAFSGRVMWVVVANAARAKGDWGWLCAMQYSPEGKRIVMEEASAWWSSPYQRIIAKRDPEGSTWDRAVEVTFRLGQGVRVAFRSTPEALIVGSSTELVDTASEGELVAGQLGELGEGTLGPGTFRGWIAWDAAIISQVLVGRLPDCSTLLGEAMERAVAVTRSEHVEEIKLSKEAFVGWLKSVLW